MFPVTRNDPSLDRVNQFLAEREFLAGQHILVLFDYLVVVQRYDSVFGHCFQNLCRVRKMRGTQLGRYKDVCVQDCVILIVHPWLPL